MMFLCTIKRYNRRLRFIYLVGILPDCGVWLDHYLNTGKIAPMKIKLRLLAFLCVCSAPVALGHAARLHAQFSTGFGESMIDYNHRQTTMGLGVLLVREW
jgi:hypothetical protein